MKTFPAEIQGDMYEVRFAYAGKIAWVGKKTGDRVKKWETIATLDKKLLQTELDRQLADYEKTRAEWELFKLKFPGDTDDAVKYNRTARNADLNASVKEVELAKYKMDEASIVSPVDGVILESGGLMPGLFITPAGSTVSVLDLTSIRAVFLVKQEDLKLFKEPQDVTLKAEGFETEYNGKTLLFPAGKKGNFSVYVQIENPENLFVGMICEVRVKAET